MAEVCQLGLVGPVEHSIKGAGGFCRTIDKDDFYAMNIESTALRAENFANRNILNTLAHEWFHAVQRGMTSSVALGPFFYVEGLASLVPDLLDEESSYLMDTATNYLQGQAFYSLPSFEVKYSGSLFWKYFTEQIGTITTEPEYGVDALTLLMNELNVDIELQPFVTDVLPALQAVGDVAAPSGVADTNNILSGALDHLYERGNRKHHWQVVLLTDAKSDFFLFYKEYVFGTGPLCGLRTNWEGCLPVIHTVGVGPDDANQSPLQFLAWRSNGSHHYIPTSA